MSGAPKGALPQPAAVPSGSATTLARHFRAEDHRPFKYKFAVARIMLIRQDGLCGSCRQRSRKKGDREIAPSLIPLRLVGFLFGCERSSHQKFG
jgi:hypothetical protein